MLDSDGDEFDLHYEVVPGEENGMVRLEIGTLSMLGVRFSLTGPTQAITNMLEDLFNTLNDR
jgi:hypothetical protein